LFFFLIQREYEEFKVRINALVVKAEKVPEEGWTMQDGSPWPGNNVRDHPGMIQVGRVLGVTLVQFGLAGNLVTLFLITLKCSIFFSNRYSLVKVVVMMWMEMNSLALFMSQGKRDQVTTITRRLVR
jgi:hypothetical protein